MPAVNSNPSIPKLSCDKALGGAEVSRLGMPCLASSNETNNQATARSRHTGGVHVLMLDGSGHFVSDTVNLDIWHRMHKRDNKDVFELPF